MYNSSNVVKKKKPYKRIIVFFTSRLKSVLNIKLKYHTLNLSLIATSQKLLNV